MKKLPTKSKPDFADLMVEINKFRDQRNWRQFHKPKDVAISLALEAAEVLEHFQWKSDEEIKDYVRTHKEHIADELSDVLYWVLLMSHDLDIDMRKAFGRKMKKNRKKYPIRGAYGKKGKGEVYI